MGCNYILQPREDVSDNRRELVYFFLCPSCLFFLVHLVVSHFSFTASAVPSVSATISGIDGMRSNPRKNQPHIPFLLSSPAVFLPIESLTVPCALCHSWSSFFHFHKSQHVLHVFQNRLLSSLDKRKLIPTWVMLDRNGQRAFVCLRTRTRGFLVWFSVIPKC